MKKTMLDVSVYKNLYEFGLEKEEIEVYIILLEQGSKSVVELSKITNISRTVLYRILENLYIKGFVKERLAENGRIFEASSLEILKMKIVEKELELQSLEQSLPEILEMLSMFSKENISKSFIKYYRGVEGLKQINWNSTKAKNEFRIYEINKLVSFTDQKFHTDLINEFVKNRIIDFQLTNFPEYDEYTENQEFVKNYWQLRYLPKNEVDFDFETMIYNDVYAMYDYKDGNIFGIEIYNERLALMQKDIFDFIWRFAKPMKLINLKGLAKVE